MRVCPASLPVTAGAGRAGCGPVGGSQRGSETGGTNISTDADLHRRQC